MEGFNIKIDYYPQDNNIVIVNLSGYIDQSNSHQIEKVISDLIRSKKQKFVFDLSQLIYMSSAGWGIFVGEIKTVRDTGGDIKLAGMSPEVYDVFQVLEFYHILEDYSTVNDAIYSFIQNGDGDTADLFQEQMSKEENKSFDNLLKFSGLEPPTPNKEDDKIVEEKSEEDKRPEIEKNETIKEERKTPVVVQRPIATGAVKRIKQLIKQGETGDIYYFDSTRVNLGLFRHDVNVIWDLAPHDISIMHYLLEQKPESVVATGAKHIANNLDDLAYITVYFPDNLMAHINVSWLSPVKVRQTLVAGSKKMVVWDDNQPSEKLRVYDKGIEVINSEAKIYQTLIQYRTGDMYCPKIASCEALSVEIEHIVNCLEGKEKPISDGKAGLQVVKVLEAAQKSIENRGKEFKVV